MVHRKHNQTAGFSLIEVLVAITILGLVIVPISSSLVLSFRLNARSGEMLQAQLAVSSAVETIMAEGYDPANETSYESQFDVAIDANGISDDDDEGDDEDEAIVVYYELTVSSGDISVDTCVRPAKGGDTT